MFYLGSGPELFLLSSANRPSYKCAEQTPAMPECSICIPSPVPPGLNNRCYLCAFGRDTIGNKCLKKGELPPKPPIPTKCKNYYEKLKCFKDFSKDPFKYKILFNEMDLDFGESPHFLVAFEKDHMDIALKQDKEITHIKLDTLSVQNNLVKSRRRARILAENTSLTTLCKSGLKSKSVYYKGKIKVFLTLSKACRDKLNLNLGASGAAGVKDLKLEVIMPNDGKLQHLSTSPAKSTTSISKG